MSAANRQAVEHARAQLLAAPSEQHMEAFARLIHKLPDPSNAFVPVLLRQPYTRWVPVAVAAYDARDTLLAFYGDLVRGTDPADARTLFNGFQMFFAAYPAQMLALWVQCGWYFDNSAFADYERAVCELCVDAAARSYNVRFVPQLRLRKTAPALLALAKMGPLARVPLDALLGDAIDAFRSDPAMVEALAYLSLQTGARRRLRTEVELLERLVGLRTGPEAYGALLVLRNLSQTHDHKTDDEPNDAIVAFNETLVALGAVRALSPKHPDLVAAFLLNVSSGRRSTLRAVVAQGGLVLLLKMEKSNEALRALANLCRDVDPRVAFSRFSPVVAVPHLLLLLDDEPLLALLALTNLLLAQQDDLLKAIARSFDRFHPHLLGPLLRPAWELVNNCIREPTMLARFFNSDNPDSMKNLDVLVKMLHSRDEQLQVVIAGLLANAMDYDLVVEVVKQHQLEQFTRISSDILTHQTNEQLLIRLLSAWSGMGTLPDGVERALDSEDAEVRELAAELLDMHRITERRPL